MNQQNLAEATIWEGGADHRVVQGLVDVIPDDVHPARHPQFILHRLFTHRGVVLSDDAHHPVRSEHLIEVPGGVGHRLPDDQPAPTAETPGYFRRDMTTEAGSDHVHLTGAALFDQASGHR